MKDHHIFFLGGTGIRVAQALVFACAHGLLSDTRLHLTVLDTDHEEQAIKKLEKTITLYQKLHIRWDMLRKDRIKQKHPGAQFPLFGAKIADFRCLPSFLQNTSSGPSTLRNVLLERNLPRAAYAVLHGTFGDHFFYQVIDNGLYANPAVGAYLLRDKMVDNSPPNGFRVAVDQPDQNEKVALCASSFGGTGVAAAEVMLKEFSAEEERHGEWYKNKMQVSTFLVQPYFTIKPRAGSNDYWDADEANRRHAEVKRHYERRGDIRMKFIEPAHKGKWMRGVYKDHEQENLPDITEWMAAIEIAAWLYDNNENETWRLRAEMMQARELFYELSVIWTKRFEPAQKYGPMFFSAFYRRCKGCTNRCWFQEGCRENLKDFLNEYYKWHRVSQTEDYTDASDLFVVCKNAHGIDMMDLYDVKLVKEKDEFSFEDKQFEHGKKLWRLAASKGYDGMEDLFSGLYYDLGRMT